MSALRGVWIGDSRRDEFRPVRAWLDSCAAKMSFAFFATVDEFAALQSPADLVIIGESWPDEFTADDVTRLVTVAPLARIVCLTGAWSEAIGRTRAHWPPAWRVPLWDAISRLERELGCLQACRDSTGTSPAAFPPWTASRQEAWLWQHSSETQPMAAGGDRTVCLAEIADPALAVWLTDQLHSAGYRTVSKAADFVLFDVDPWSPVRADQLREGLARHTASIPIMLTAWSTPALRSELAAVGVTSIADKLAPASLLRILSDESRLDSPKKPA